MCDCSDRPAVPAAPSRLTGHFEDCPTHALILGAYERGEQEPEDRGTPHWVWTSGATTRFEPFPEAEQVIEVSLPIGWRLVPDVGSGVALASTFGDRLTAGQVWGLAASGGHGFKVRSAVDFAGPAPDAERLEVPRAKQRGLIPKIVLEMAERPEDDQDRADSEQRPEDE